MSGVGIPQHQDFPGYALPAQLRALQGCGHTKVVDAQTVQLPCHQCGPVAIGVGLYSGHQLAALGAKAFQLMDIVGQRFAVQLNPCPCGRVPRFLKAKRPQEWRQ